MEWLTIIATLVIAVGMALLTLDIWRSHRK